MRSGAAIVTALAATLSAASSLAAPARLEASAPRQSHVGSSASDGDLSHRALVATLPGTGRSTAPSTREGKSRLLRVSPAPAVAVTSNATAAGSEVSGLVEVGAAKARALVAALKDADEQLKAKERELKVQTGIVREKESAVGQVLKQVSELEVRAGKLRKEADAAAEFARERAEAAATAEREEHGAEGRARDLQAEERETQKFLQQTKLEERELARKVASLRQARAVALQASHTATTPKRAIASTASAHVVAASVPANLTGVSQAPDATRSGRGGDNMVLTEAMQKLVAENRRLKHEKEELERKLAASRVAQEKDRLRQQLKNKLASVDHRVKAKAL